MTEKEKAKDKKIRKAILNGLIDCRDAPDLGWSNFGGIHIDDCIAWLEKQGEQAQSQINERAWLYLVSDVLTWKDGIGQYLDDPRVQEFAKRLCSKYSQKLYNPSKFALENQWISIKDDLPCNHEELIDIDTRSIHQKTLFVIVWNGKFIDIDFMFYKKGKWEWVCNNSNTHWFPMPKPPKE